jgi:phosphinothricin acetyltransferase
MNIRPVASDDAERISRIYNHYIATSHATFELESVDASEMKRRIADTLNQGFPYLVADDDKTVAGYTYGRPFRPRPGYRHAVEVAVYVNPDRQGRGLGKALYGDLFPQLFERGAHSLIATIALPNDASVRLHEGFGFVNAGHFREVGRKFDRWIDVGYWQLIRQTD